MYIDTYCVPCMSVHSDISASSLLFFCLKTTIEVPRPMCVGVCTSDKFLFLKNVITHSC
jgi:hypothetical protein